jgi:CPA2 family monovalent cation:H+ antiporter-2
LIDKVASAENREILLISVLGVCFGYALLANIVGLSVAIGAFLAGVLVAESKSAEVSKIL